MTTDEKNLELNVRNNELVRALEAVHATANEADAFSTPSDLHELLQRISSDAYGALS